MTTKNTSPAAAPIMIKIQDLEIGHRYVETISDEYNDNWTVASVESRLLQCQVLREGGWTTPVVVDVTYRNGKTVTHEYDTEIAADCDIDHN